MAAVMSWPLTVSVEWLASLPGVIWWSVMKPSIRTSGVPLIVAINMTRTSGIGEPPLTRNSVCSGELLLSVKDSSKTLGVAGPEFDVTLTLVRASRITCGTGTATTGPIISVRWTPLSTCNWSWYAFRQGNVDRAAHDFEFFGNRHTVRVAQAPELFGIAEKTCGHVIEPVALHHDVLPQEREVRRIWQHAPIEIRNWLATGQNQRVRPDAVVAAGRRQGASRRRAELDRLLDGIVAVAHGICSIPRPVREPTGLLDRRFSFCCR